MRRFAAAGMLGLALIGSGAYILAEYHQYHKDVSLSADFSQVLAELLIAAKITCNMNSCRADNVVSNYFTAESISIDGMDEVFGFLKDQNIKSHVLTELSNSWFQSFRGSKLWWLIYDSKRKSEPNFKIEISNLELKLDDFNPMLLLLSKESRQSLMKLSTGVDVKLIFNNLQRFIKFSDRKNSFSYKYDFLEHKSYESDSDFADLFEEFDRLIPFHVSLK